MKKRRYEDKFYSVDAFVSEDGQEIRFAILRHDNEKEAKEFVDLCSSNGGVVPRCNGFLHMGQKQGKKAQSILEFIIGCVNAIGPNSIKISVKKHLYPHTNTNLVIHEKRTELDQFLMGSPCAPLRKITLQNGVTISRKAFENLHYKGKLIDRYFSDSTAEVLKEICDYYEILHNPWASRRELVETLKGYIYQTVKEGTIREED